MNTVFFLLLFSSIATLCFTAPESVLPAMITGAENSIKLCLTLLAIYCVWLSVLKIMEECGINEKINKLLSPITKRLFKGENQEAAKNIGINLSANLLGMGGAATPTGIKAIENMQKRKDGKASDNMILFTVINCTSIQLLPTTIIGLRAAGGSANPADIILPSLIATASSTLIGVILCKILGSGKK